MSDIKELEKLPDISENELTSIEEFQETENSIEEFSDANESKHNINDKIMKAIKNPGGMLTNALNKLKGRDIETLVEDFSSEVTLIIEGLSDDQEKLGNDLSDAKSRIVSLEKRISELEKKPESKSSKPNVLRQITWLAGIVIVGLIIISVINALN